MHDIHIHSKYSLDGRGEVSEIASVAAERGLQFIAITDHVPPDPDWLPKLAQEARIAEEEYGIKVFAGVEAGIKDFHGNLFLDPKYYCRAKLVIAAVHIFVGVPYGYCNGIHWSEPILDGFTREKLIENCLKQIEGAVRNPVVDIIAHPFWLLREHNVIHDPSKDIPREVKLRLARTLADSDVAIEVNSSAQLPDEETLRLCLKEGVKLALGSDAHRPENVGNLQWALKVLKRVGATREDLITEDYILKRLKRKLAFC